MIITTSVVNNGQIAQCSMFDTQTGIRYRIAINPQVKYIDPVRVDVCSAHTSGGESDFSGVIYYGKEAADFWHQLIEGAPDMPVARETLLQDALHAAQKAISDKEFQDALEAQKRGETVFEDDLDIPY